MSGCTKTQDDVARLMSRLRLINGVTRVTLSDTQKQDAAQAAVAVAGATGAGATNCGTGTPSFDLVIFFKPIAGAGPAGPATALPQQVSNSTVSPGGSR
jgi:hypothetical protein